MNSAISLSTLKDTNVMKSSSVEQKIYKKNNNNKKQNNSPSINSNKGSIKVNPIAKAKIRSVQ